ncbi:beta-ketoacyl-[acyl-carrier-protein] synthase family protein [Streptomyces sp. NRRL B-1140]|uniref:beta-ketoacyl-[acyl-carrier-protein] synthase family protein n=1 Tax=Streptomyces sp. NRRL B-1140 TaxID=1415549 RepID=UPI0006ADE280|nr:beta-ketoacyl-[acyl-carrier-protein] synthase family protein [Streptomyces sp. NRRL B-1140]
MSRRIAVTGTGAVTALGNGADVLHARVVAGHSGLADGVGRCREFVPEHALNRKEKRRTDRCTQLAMAACQEAMAQAGWTEQMPYDGGRVACVVGTGIGGFHTLRTQLDVLREDGPDAVSGLTIPMMMANATPAQLSLKYGFRGESWTVMSACAAGAQAIGSGVRLIRAGEADAAVVGGTEAGLSEFMHAAFLNAGALSPTGTSTPFAKDRDGFIMGEGAGILVLEDLESAERRGATVLAELVGYGSTTDAHHVTAPEPSGTTAALAVRKALDDAGLAPSDIGYINAHGTGTVLNDLAEATAMASVLGDELSRIPMSSTKASIGHLLGAAGAVEAVAAVQALRHRVVPPTVGLADPDPQLDGVRHVLKACALEKPVALSTSFGFGGHNAVLVLKGGTPC